MNATANPKFDRLITLEESVKHNLFLAQAGMFSWDRDRGREQWNLQRAELKAAIAALSMDELIAFQQYRTAAR